MALFTRKTKATKKEADSHSSDATVPSIHAQSLAHVLKSPRITEKASMAMEGFTYVFDVAPTANKREIMAAIKSVYKVEPRKVAIVNTKPKATRNMRTGKSGLKGGGKKAYVFLEKGQTITIA